MSEFDAERVFIEYVVSARSPEVIQSFVKTSGVAVACFAFSWMKFAEDQTVFGGMGMTVGIVCAVLSANSIWRYISNRDEETRITDHGVSYDSQSWGWEAVKQVDFLKKQRCLFFHVNNGFGRSQLTILVRVPKDAPKSTMQEVREFVESRGIRIRDRGA